jgi:hypothetical protein
VHDDEEQNEVPSMFLHLDCFDLGDVAGGVGRKVRCNDLEHRANEAAEFKVLPRSGAYVVAYPDCDA